MPTIITTPKAVEQSAYVLTAAFTDENSDPFTPNEVAWTLTRMDGTVINSREDVEITSLETSVDILLYGDDLTLSEEDRSEQLALMIEGTYDSTLGDDIPFKDEVFFTVVSLVGLT